ncbi:class I SAM-dependent methyltransferase [Solimonas marina]|uniref:Class I SAM-dependent methyltransferase n=1 Tax=Solimonas marina TaxID=2714601 RepID=A0A969WBV8_9GAMM|nr:class I SAM-dependent methyltransferase [Solimonas marina]NKF22005.1 class I SAM-dependent methyltransferase [Solimonas marina]
MSCDTVAQHGETISPTAYATGYFWYRHGLSHAAFATRRGRRIDFAFDLLARGTKTLSGYSIEALMLARHRGLDARLQAAIDDGRIGQVIEIAAGLSPRGWAFCRRYGPALHYVETDLAAMADAKHMMLDEAGLLSARHRVVTVDVLADEGPQSLAAVAATLDPTVGTAIVSEGLMNYLDDDTARAVWRRIAATLSRFPNGVYLSDLYLRERRTHPALAAFGALLGRFVRGRMHLHFSTTSEADAALRTAGFTQVRAIAADEIDATRCYASTRGGDAVRILEAWTSAVSPRQRRMADAQPASARRK